MPRNLKPSREGLYGSNGRPPATAVLVPTHTPPALAAKAGYAPERLDEVIEQLICNAEQGALLLGKYTPVLDAVMHQLSEMVHKLLIAAQGPDDPNDPKAAEEGPTIGEIVEMVDQLSSAMDRIGKMVNNAVKSKDDASRLRSFLAGDHDRGDLADLSEIQLRKLVLEAASGFAPKPEDQP